MNFFKSVFSEDPDPPKPESPSRSNDDDPNRGPTWSFGGLIKTLATQSESVIETYRRDLQEFGSGLKKEIEVAQGSIGTVGTAIDELGSSVMKGTAEIIAQGRDAILAEGHDSDSSESNPNPSSKPYSRFESQVRAIQSDPSTYCDEPEDSDDYLKWKLGFALEEREIEEVIRENGSAIDGVYERVVPGSVDRETFWCRYFYKVHKLKQAEGLRANLAMKRAIPGEEDEDLSWDVDDDDHEEDSKANREKIGQEEESKMEPKSDEEKKSEEEEEEDVGWDEIEDLSSIDTKKIASDELSPKIAELRKRLSIAATAEDEDLSWGIEDDDDPPLPQPPKA